MARNKTICSEPGGVQRLGSRLPSDAALTRDEGGSLFPLVHQSLVELSCTASRAASACVATDFLCLWPLPLCFLLDDRFASLRRFTVLLTPPAPLPTPAAALSLLWLLL